MTLTFTQLRCLLALLALSRVKEQIPSKDVARTLGVSRPSVHTMLDFMSCAGLIENKPYGAARLTPKGISIAEQAEKRMRRVKHLFEQMSLPPAESARAAVLLMSALSEESLITLEAASAGVPKF